MSKINKPVFTVEAIVFAAALLITLPLRTIQYYTIVEDGTGFYEKADFNLYLYVILIVAAFAYFIISAVSKRKKISLETAPVKLPGCGILAALSALSVGFSVYIDYSSRNIDASSYTVTSTASEALTSRIAMLQAVSGLATAVFFIMLAVVFMSGQSPSRYTKLLSLCPVVWYTIKLVSRFTRTISYLRVSDLTIEMMAFAFMVVFFMAFAQTNSQVETNVYEWKLAAFGFSGSLFALNCFVPRAILLVSGNADKMYILSHADPSDIIIPLFIIATVTTRIIPRNSNIIPEKTAE